jgi:predicted SAM-dependent methyltransferase
VNLIKPHMLLDIGSGNPQQGEVQPQGYVLNDVEPHENIDIVCNIKDLAQYIPEGYCSKVRSSHILEHFGTKEVIDVIKMIHSLLEKDGEFIIFVPNFKWHGQLLSTGNDEMAVLYAFGGQLDQYDYHKTGFTPKVLRKYLEENGFKVISLLEGSSIECHAIKI